jgi:universal stress protein A
MLKNILMATDFSAASKAALSVAIRFCKSSGARLHVIHVLPKMEGRVYAVMSRLAEKDMQSFFPSRLYLKCQKEVLFSDSASDAILTYANEQSCGLIVIGFKDRSGIGDFLAGSVVRPLVQRSTIPVMLVCNAGRMDRIRRILVPFDFSALSKRALTFAAQSAKSLSAEIHVVYVIDPRVAPYSGELNMLIKKLDVRINRLVKSLATASGLSSKRFNAVILNGNPTEEIRKYIHKNKMDLIVTGTHRSKGRISLLVPGTASRLLTKIPEITIS